MGAAATVPADEKENDRETEKKEKKSEPCQEEFDAYMRCCKSNEMTQDMNDCEEITTTFQQCMRRSKGIDKVSVPQVDLPAGIMPEGHVLTQHVGPRSVNAGYWKKP
mmetsp:Transcript_11630/g.17521  ORF Transcript_11630/g.17521 Transcript_11630/m.17521 type:complete len:107 (-) Transcript_11630:131-451(-)